MEFDAYYEWLGIPPHEQPPNHYRLLGLAVLEANPNVISSAADRQMLHLRSFQNGPHSARSQRLLNEVAAARVCLLNPQKKAEYDQRLFASLQATQSPQRSAVMARPLPVGPVEEVVPLEPADSAPGTANRDVAALAQVAELARNKSPATTTARKRAPSGAKNTMEVIKVVVGGVAGISIAILALWLGFRKDPLGLFGPKAPSGTQKSGDSGPGATVAKNSKPSLDTTPDKSNSSSPPSTKTQPTPSVPPAGFGTKGKPNVSPTPNVGSNHPNVVKPSPRPGPGPLPKPKTNPEPSDAHPEKASRALVLPRTRQPTERAPVPAADALAPAQATLRDLFRSRYDEVAKLPSDEKRVKLAELIKELTGIARDETDEAAAYATFDLALRLACAGGDMDSVADTVQSLALRFDNDEAVLLIDSARRAIDGIGKEADGADDQAVRLGQLAQRLLQSAATWEGDLRFQDAVRIWEFLASDLAESVDVSTRSELGSRRDAVLAKAAKQTEVLAQLDELSQSPDDPPKQSSVASYLAFDLGQWQAALPHFARGDEPRWKAAAERELNRPRTVDDQTAAGDLWWDLYESTTGAQQDLAKRRAIQWYRQAKGQARGLVKVKLDERLAKLEQEVAFSQSQSAASVADPPGTVVISLDLSQERTLQRLPMPQGASQDRVFMEVVRFESPVECTIKGGRNVVSLGTPLTIEFADADNVWLEITALKANSEEVTVRITPLFKLTTNQEFPFTIPYLEERAKGIDARMKKTQGEALRARQTAATAEKLAKDSSTPKLQRANATVTAQQQTSAAIRLEAKLAELLAIKSVLPKAMDYADKLNGHVKLHVLVR